MRTMLSRAPPSAKFWSTSSESPLYEQPDERRCGRGSSGDRTGIVNPLRSRGRIQQRNAQRALEKAKKAAGLDALNGRLSWHSLRHSACSIWLTEQGQPITTVSAMMGHANPAFTLAFYGRDPRDEQTMIADVLTRGRLLKVRLSPNRLPGVRMTLSRPGCMTSSDVSPEPFVRPPRPRGRHSASRTGG
jgi:hypothetical protein